MKLTLDEIGASRRLPMLGARVTARVTMSDDLGRKLAAQVPAYQYTGTDWQPGLRAGKYHGARESVHLGNRSDFRQVRVLKNLEFC